RHQESARLLHREPARLHVRSDGRGRLRARCFSLGDARVFQGLLIPRRRQRHPRDGRGAGYDKDGWAQETYAAYVHYLSVGHARHNGLSGHRGIFLKGWHSRGGLWPRRNGPLAGGTSWCRLYRLLHVASGVYDVFRRKPCRRAYQAPSARIARRYDLAAGDSRFWSFPGGHVWIAGVSRSPSLRGMAGAGLRPWPWGSGASFARNGLIAHGDIGGGSAGGIWFGLPHVLPQDLGSGALLCSRRWAVLSVVL